MSRTVEQIQFAPQMPKALRVAAYARVSSGKDAILHSLAAQVDHYSTYIRHHPGWEYVGVYMLESARAFSGFYPPTAYSASWRRSRSGTY